jgi:hypothetical protein
MGKDSNIVHQYFKREFEDMTVLVKVNPFHFRGIEITVSKQGEPEAREMEFDPEIFDDLKTDGFVEASAMEFNLYLSGLAGGANIE